MLRHCEVLVSAINNRNAIAVKRLVSPSRLRNDRLIRRVVGCVGANCRSRPLILRVEDIFQPTTCSFFVSLFLFTFIRVVRQGEISGVDGKVCGRRQGRQTRDRRLAQHSVRREQARHHRLLKGKCTAVRGARATHPHHLPVLNPSCSGMLDVVSQLADQAVNF